MGIDKENVTRRKFLNGLTVTVGAAGLATATGAATYFAAPRLGRAQPAFKGDIPDTPYKTGHITYLTGPANLLGEPGRQGHILAAEEINAEGGLLGKRQIETIFADEAAGTDANVKELRRMKLSEGIDLFTGVISSGNTPALGPVAEELGVLTLFNDGCTDFLFDTAVPDPHYTFRITNIQSADGITSAVGAATLGREASRSARSNRTTATAATSTSISCWRTRAWFPARKPSPRRGRSCSPPTSPPTSPSCSPTTPIC